MIQLAGDRKPQPSRYRTRRLGGETFTIFEQGVHHGGQLLGVEVERRRKDGSAVFIRLSSSILHDDKGRPTGVLSTAEDVTEKKLAVQTQQRVSRLESLGVLAGGIAHDFNNVLMRITGNIDLAKSENDPGCGANCSTRLKTRPRGPSTSPLSC
jgi:hypothetical protein